MNPLVIRVEDAKGNVLAVFSAKPTDFKTGSKGYRAVAKVDGAEGKRYQVNFQAVEIHSKPNGDDQPDAEQDAEASE